MSCVGPDEASLASMHISCALEFLNAAEKLNEFLGDFSPKYFLLSHAIELALKAQILATGGTEWKTHSLRNLMDMAVELGYVPSNPESLVVINELNEAHDSYLLRYKTPGLLSIPHTKLVTESAWSILRDVKPHVNAAVTQHFGK